MSEWQEGDQFVIDYGEDTWGRWWWRLRHDPEDTHGPFQTKEDCEADSREVMKVTPRGRLQ